MLMYKIYFVLVDNALDGEKKMVVCATQFLEPTCHIVHINIRIIRHVKVGIRLLQKVTVVIVAAAIGF